MKNTIKLLGIIGFIVVLGLVFVACEQEPAEVRIRGTARIGQTVSATSSNGTFTGSFRWEYSAVGERRDWGTWTWGAGMNTGATLQNMELGSGTQGRFLRASRLLENGDRIFSNVIGPIEAY